MEKTMNIKRRFEKIDRYELVSEIARGGMGVVYQAYDPFMDRFVALKLPQVQAASPDDESFERLFYNETNAASRLRHPNIIAVHNASVDNGVHYISMEYVAGGVTLKNFCDVNNLLPLELAGEMLLRAAEALDYAHRKGIMHRDIKPSNILLKDDREVKISDFGLAMLVDPDLVSTVSVKLMGSPRYMAPERLNEETLTHQSDIYSLGVVMYELLTGQAPFDASNLMALTRQILMAEVTPPSQYRGNLSPSIDAVVMQAMARKPQDRYASMSSFAEALNVCFKEAHVLVDGETTEFRTEQIRQLELFQGFSDSDLWELLRWSEWLEVDDDEVIFSEGDMGSDVFVIVKGGAAVVKAGQELAKLKYGEIFGEIAFLADRERTATVVSKGSSTLLRLRIKQIEQASTLFQIQFQRMFISTLIDRLVKTTDKLMQ